MERKTAERAIKTEIDTRRIKRSGQSRLVYVSDKPQHPHYVRGALGDSKRSYRLGPDTGIKCEFDKGRSLVTGKNTVS